MNIIFVSMVIIGLAFSFVGLSSYLWFIGTAWFCIGLFIPIVNTVVVTIFQQQSKPNMLGRVFSIARMMAWISLPLAQVLAGVFADQLALYLGGVLVNPLGTLYILVGLIIVGIIIIFSRLPSLKRLNSAETKANTA
ncbi:hypothetical protein LGQ02_10155 [Bacillus shivajii]|uniref:hypothetical protein n=1 Tax=Bacillus shivajii TaxID=1983719 RepID=UPI001CFB75AA|nr:hypothetical protein [Bacillus shivajii]UCZ55055.1 hypothetical protein LGQ02_10155 [Bacillus shivajii]